MLTLHPTERLDIVKKDDPSLSWRAWKSAAVARAGWRRASRRDSDGIGEPVPEGTAQHVVTTCLWCGCGGGSETGCAAGEALGSLVAFAWVLSWRIRILREVI